MARVWVNTGNINPRKFTCGHCGTLNSSIVGYFADTSRGPTGLIYICAHCGDPTFFGDKQVPGPVPGNSVGHLPPEIAALYVEARNCVAVGATTASVLACRKLLMHIAVEQGAKPGETFIAYVEYLATTGYVPPNGKPWVDHIRKKGNEANHDIVLMSEADATELIKFLEMLMKFIYEFPQSVPAASAVKPPS